MNDLHKNDFFILSDFLISNVLIGRLSGNETRLCGLVFNNKSIEKSLILNGCYW